MANLISQVLLRAADKILSVSVDDDVASNDGSEEPCFCINCYRGPEHYSGDNGWPEHLELKVGKMS